MDINLIMNGVLMVLLVTVLWYGVGLNKRLKALRAAHEGFAKAVGELDDAAIRAHTALRDLRASADDSQELLHGRVLAARDVLQKLDMQVTRAERVQSELDKGVAGFEALRSQQAVRIEPRLEPRPLPVRTDTPRNEVIRPVHYDAQAEEVEAPKGRHPFLNDIVRTRDAGPRENRPKEMPLSQTPYAQKSGIRTGRSLLPEVMPEDESEMVDAVQMSELVVANLNEMIRTLNLPTRQVLSVEDDLFGGDMPAGKR